MTGLHLYSRGRSADDLFGGSESQSTVGDMWKALPDDGLQSYRDQAQFRRGVARAQDPISHYADQVEEVGPREGPWNLSSETCVFAMHPEVIDEVYNNSTLNKTVSAWDKKFNPTVHPSDPLPETVPAFGHDVEEVPVGMQSFVSAMLDTTRLALKYADKSVDAGVLLEFRCDDMREFVLVPHSQHLEREGFEAEMIYMQVVPGSVDPAGDDFVLTYSQLSGPNFDIETETQFIVHLATRQKTI